MNEASNHLLLKEGRIYGHRAKDTAACIKASDHAGGEEEVV